MSGLSSLGNEPTPEQWRDAYAALLERLPGIVASARLTLCGMSTCVDAYIRLESADALLDAPPGTPQGAFAARILDRARQGIGGEMRIDWPQGPAWLEANLPITLGLGGTGAQAAQMLATLGAPSLVAVGDRTARQIERFHPEVGLAGPDGPTTMGSVQGHAGIGKQAHYIIEFRAGTRMGGHVLPRSSRIICRFGDDPLEDDPPFEAQSIRLAGQAGAAILAGYNEVPALLMEQSLRHTAGLARAWREAGLRLIHLELGDFHDMNDAWTIFAGLHGAICSVGLSLSELDKLMPGSGPVASRAACLGERLGIDRVAVHYDTYALALTKDDPALELEALMTGSLLASTRAANGKVTVPRQIAQAAIFKPAPLPPIGRSGAWNIATCATPWLHRPAATIGLGDTFLAGTLLVLGGRRRDSA